MHHGHAPDSTLGGATMPETFELPLGHDGRLGTFRRPSVPKYGIYVIRINGEVVRIGESSSGADRIFKGLREPLRRILRGKDRKNYLAYHWRTDYCNVSTAADYFALPEDPFADNHLRRALEAEVTVQFRLACKAWPKCMSEIHFLERCRKDANVLAQGTQILAHYGHSYDNAA